MERTDVCCASLDHVCDTPITADAADDHQIEALQTGPERDATDARRAEALLGFVSGTERRIRDPARRAPDEGSWHEQSRGDRQQHEAGVDGLGGQL